MSCELEQFALALETTSAELLEASPAPAAASEPEPPLQQLHPATPPAPKPGAPTTLRAVVTTTPSFARVGSIVPPRLPTTLRERSRYPEPSTEFHPDPLPDPPRVTRKLRASRGGLPNWVISAVVTLVVLLAAASSVQKFIAAADAPPSAISPVPKHRVVQVHAPVHLQASAQTTTPAILQTQVPTPPAQPPEPVDELPDGQIEHPFAAMVDVSNLRVVPVGGLPQVQYLVENRAPEDLSNLGLRIIVRPLGSFKQKPLFVLDARVPTLRAHEVKEIRTNLDSSIDVRQAADPQKLKISVKVTLQQ